MKRSEFVSKLRDYARTLSPTSEEQKLISGVYASFNDLLGVNNCIQIGSYPRFTAVTPIHDLDILYLVGPWDENSHTPHASLQNLQKNIRSRYVNPTSCEIYTSLQTHSVTVEFRSESEVVFSVDIVPAYSFGKNEFGQDTYKVPEVIKANSHAQRESYYSRLLSEKRVMSWINTDPRGYLKVATEVGQNPDFRKAVKIIKTWKSRLRYADDSLKLKSFHLEQVLTRIFQENPNIDIFDAIFKFFYDLPNIILLSDQIADRADNNKYVDDYLDRFDEHQKEKIEWARNGFLINLERLTESDVLESSFDILFYEKSKNEEFMFDKGIATFLDPCYHDFKLSADITDKQGNVQRRLNPQGGIESERYLIFNKSMTIDGCHYMWKVKNDDECAEPRGEITLHRTKNVPEHTKFKGTHYVECYAILDRSCVAVARHYVMIY